ncbi:recombinase RecA [Haloprofundus marisrubri]|uniref:non-specific serine/threonine protein kinase n=1 Tax=Haloprofundus marisrubri TaxID=1514971 RepID=A0A0W1R967_9EURY|nr:ATPase domain-containing protein [Haloprofundus marisrubri]KTG09850.1 recombinase RecA [Haloprofundus marisrubri]
MEEVNHESAGERSTTKERVSAGIGGLDDVLHGGFVPNRTYMVRGEPGAGKSILGMHFLRAGLDAGESVLYINLEESTENVRENAASLGIDLDGVKFLDLSPDSEYFAQNLSYDIFSPDEVESESVTEEITERVEELNPDRLFIDPLTQLRYLAPDDYQFRKQVLSLMRFFNVQGSTVLFTAQATQTRPDDDLQFICDGTLQLAHEGRRRSLTVSKFRGSGFESGPHTLTIDGDGMSVYLNSLPRVPDHDFESETISSGVPELDQLLHGGIERGTVTILTGPTGVGKTTTGIQFMKEAAGRGERSVVYLFEETKRTLAERSSAVNIPIDEMLDQGTLEIEEMEPLAQTPDQFNEQVRHAVEANDAEIVMIDGVVGYEFGLLGGEDELVRNLHTLCKYLKKRGVTVILINEVQSITGDFQVSGEGLSYLADNIVFLQHLELAGEMRKAAGVLKKRTSDYERQLREFRITEYGVEIGEPLTGLRGILSGRPERPTGTDGRNDRQSTNHE